MSAATSPAPEVDVVAILCTYRRPDHVERYLDALASQTVRARLVLVVDNDGSPEVARICANCSTLPQVRYLDAGSNVGPAGALRMGLDHICYELRDHDWVLHGDDDDPPVASDQLARLLESGIRILQLDRRFGGVGLSGGNLSHLTGRVKPVPTGRGLQRVDHLHGGYLPLYRSAALLDVGGNDPGYFFGFEELELGRRMTLAGWNLYVDRDLMEEVRQHYPKRTAGRSASHEPFDRWSRFHKERNLIRILRRERAWLAIGLTTAARHLARPMLLLVRRPREGWGRLVLGVRAVVSGIRDEAGVDPRYPPGR